MKNKKLKPRNTSWQCAITITSVEYQTKKIKVFVNYYLVEISLCDIVKVTAHRCYSIFHLKDETTIRSKLLLKECASLLPKGFFGRYHLSTIINWMYVVDINIGKRGSVLMSNRTIVNISEGYSHHALIDFEASKKLV